MVRYVVYAEREQDITDLEAFLRKATYERGEWPLVHFFIGSGMLSDYLKFVRQNPCLIMLEAASGAHGREAAKRIRENNRDARMLWFSDRANGVCSYQIGVTWFGLLPVTADSVARALDACAVRSCALRSSQSALSAHYITVTE